MNRQCVGEFESDGRPPTLDFALGCLEGDSDTSTFGLKDHPKVAVVNSKRVIIPGAYYSVPLFD